MLIAVWKKYNKQIHGAHYSHFFQEEAILDQVLQFLNIAQNRADLVCALFILLKETSLALLTRLYTDSCIGTIYYPLLVACGIIISSIAFSRLLTEDRMKRLAMLHNVKVAQQPQQHFECIIFPPSFYSWMPAAAAATHISKRCEIKDVYNDP
jgi:hypothetical protein